MIKKEDWLQYFPFKETRKQQEQSINFALNSFFKENKKYVILECPTGVEII